MTIRFKCQHCQKALGVPDHLAGKRAACPVCKKAITIPTPAPVTAPVDVEAFAAEALADKPVEQPPEPVSDKTIDFECVYCGEELKLPFALGGKMEPCPFCKKIIKVPQPKVEKPKDWRSTQKAGPSLAVGNQQEQLADAWGTEQKGKVSREAMEEAGALPEPVAKPLGVTGWLRRGAWLCLLVGGGYLLITAGKSAAVNKAKKDHLAKVHEAMPKLDALHKAEVYRVEGDIAVSNRTAGKAQASFNLARSTVPLPAAREELASKYEHDLFLIRLALSQVEMGGAGDDVLKRGKDVPRFDWKESTVQKEIKNTLNMIRTDDAKKSALRDLTSKLIDKEKLEVAAEILTGQVGERSPFLAQFVGLLLARNDDKAAGNLLDPPDPKYTTDALARVAYTEGQARKRNYDDALKTATSPGPAAGRLEACVAGAAIAMADGKNKDAAKNAVPFITAAVDIYSKELAKDSKERVPWPVMELIRLGSRTEARDAIKDLVGKLPPPFRPRAQLDFYIADLEKPPSTGAAVPIDDIGDDKCPLRCFGWEAFARHHARRGDSGHVRFEAENEMYWPFLHLGLALGEQERNNN